MSFLTIYFRYAGYDRNACCEIAWNVIPLSVIPKVEQKRIILEAKLMQTLNHKNIIHCLSTWYVKETETIVTITEKLNSGSLSEYFVVIIIIK